MTNHVYKGDLPDGLDLGPIVGIRSVDVVVTLRVCPLGGSHGTDDGHLIRMLGGALKVLPKLKAINLG